MTAVYIILGVIALLLLLLMIKVTVKVDYCRDIEVSLKYLFISYTVFRSGEEKGGHKSGDTGKKKKKPEKKGEKDKKKKGGKSEPELVRPPLGELVPAVRDELGRVLKKLGKSARLEKARFHCLVATDDPAKTAVLYGAISGAAGDIFGMLSKLKRRSKRKGTVDFLVEPDFIAEKFDLLLDIRVSFIPLKLAFAALCGWLSYKKVKRMWKEKPAGEAETNDENKSTTEEQNNE